MRTMCSGSHAGLVRVPVRLRPPLVCVVQFDGQQTRACNVRLIPLLHVVQFDAPGTCASNVRLPLLTRVVQFDV